MSVTTRRDFIHQATWGTIGFLTLSSFTACSSLASTARVLGSVASLISILEYFGVRPKFSAKVDYSKAGSCTQNYKSAEAWMKGQSYYLFSGVHRAPYNHDFALLIGKSSNGGAGSLQYGDALAQTLTGYEPDALRVAMEFISQEYSLSKQDVARSVGVISKRSLPIRNKEAGRVTNVQDLLTAAGGHIAYDSTPHEKYTAGRVSIFVPGKTDPNDWPEIGLTL